MKYLALLLLLPLSAAADPWVFEWELGAPVPSSTSRLLLRQCTKVVPVQYVELYIADPRKGWEISCGNEVPIYTHWLGRKIGRPLPNLELEIGWRHLSSPGDQQEFEFDLIGIKGRFEWGKNDAARKYHHRMMHRQFHKKKGGR